MELVLLGDIQNGYASNWARIANTTGVSEIQIGDRFREQGFGAGAEELEVAGIDISVVGGASRLFFNRAANATQPEVHRLGAVLLQVGIVADPPALSWTETPIFNDAVDMGHANLLNTPANGPTSAAEGDFSPSTRAGTETGPPLPLEETMEPLVPLKRGRGRPRGAKNKAKEEVAFPPGF